MTKPNAPVFAPYLKGAGHALTTHASRSLLLACTVALAACSSTPLPQWPASTSPARSQAATQTSANTPSSSTAPARPVVSVSPVAPSAALEPLPYSAAIAQLFPDPSERYSTPGLSEGRSHFTTNAELAELLRNISQPGSNSTVRLGIIDSGSSQNGNPIMRWLRPKPKQLPPWRWMKVDAPA